MTLNATLGALRAPSLENPSLRTLLEQGLCLLALLRNGASPPGPEVFRTQLETLLARFERQALALGKPPEAVAEAKYAFCALADEILLASGSTLREDWGRAPLQLTLFGEHLAGEGFFQHLDRLRAAPANQAEALEVYHTCLLLGFQGRYLLEAPEQLHLLTTQVGQELVRSQGQAPSWTAPALPAFHFAGPGGRRIPLGRFWLLLAGVALFVLLGFRLNLHLQTRALARSSAPASQLPPGLR